MLTYSDGKHVFSVDLMFLWIKKYNPKVHIFEISQLDPEKIKFQSANVKFGIKKLIEHPDLDRDHYSRLRKADLAYPIIVWRKSSGNLSIVDGVHRIGKSWFKKLTTIKTYIFDDAAMKKFIVGSGINPIKAEANVYRELFEYRFSN